MSGLLNPANIPSHHQKVELIGGHAGLKSHEGLIVKKGNSSQNDHGERNEEKVHNAPIDFGLEMFGSKKQFFKIFAEEVSKNCMVKTY